MGQAADLSVDVTQRLDAAPQPFVVAPSFDVALPPGAIVVLFGPSGAGKTTILRQLAGLERPDRGVIRAGGATWCDVGRGVWVPPQQRRVGLVLQQPSLFPHISVRGNIFYGRRASDGADAQELSRLLGALGVDAWLDRRPRTLSGGEAQRVALARALAHAPQIALLDEPFASLDTPTRTRLRGDVRQLLRRTGTPAVFVTHDRAEAMALGDQIVVVLAGRVRQVGGVADVFSRPIDADVAAALGVEAVLAARVVAASGGVLTIAVGGRTIHVAEREPLDVGTNVFACIRAEDVTIEMRSPAHASARNHLAARVASITTEGVFDRVALDCGFTLDALITHQSREELGLVPGAEVVAAIKATAVHLVRLA
jgi:molybdate transport system ATP-binding protein